MSVFKNITLLTLLFISCNNNALIKDPSADKLIDSLFITTPENAVKLTQFTSDFILKNKIDEWPDFILFKESMEDLSKLNPKGVIIFLSELYKITKQLLQSPFPKTFDGLPVYSRIKVVQTQIIKCHFYASNNQSQKLNNSLDELYLEYNILLSRMVSFVEEREIPLDSFGNNKLINQVSKTYPAFSKK
tara:strand:+ start:42 stop:608 length:567 start_codon:yes stop_codon:yes gene_type:complete